MEDIKKSEAYSDVGSLLEKYKRFCFGAFGRIPYPAVPDWIAFADNRMDDALAKKRGIIQNIRDYYILSLIGIIAGLLSVWYVVAFYAAIFVGVAVIGGALAFLSNPLLVVGIIVGLLVFFTIVPPLMFLLRGALFHVVLRFFGAKGSYSDTLTVTLMSNATAIIYNIPIYVAFALIVGLFISPLSYLVSIYSLYMMYRGMKHVHAMESRNAAIAIIAAIAIEIAIYFALAILIYVLIVVAGLAARGI